MLMLALGADDDCRSLEVARSIHDCRRRWQRKLRTQASRRHIIIYWLVYRRGRLETTG
jgi:hypothetical protein